LRGAERTTPSFLLRIGSNSFTTYKGTFFFSFPGFLASGSDTVTILGFFFFVTRHANRALLRLAFLFCLWGSTDWSCDLFSFSWSIVEAWLKHG
jgi:hypothetical protein